MVQPTENCTLCQKRRGPEDTTHTAYCRECWKAKQREYRRVNGPRRPAENCSACGAPREIDGYKGHPNYCRACWNDRQREYRDKTRVVVAAVPIQCETCEQEIQEPRPRQRYCSSNCKMKARYKRLNPKPLRFCPGCGDDITHMRADALYCSGKCTERTRRSDGRVTSEMRRHSRLVSEYGVTAEVYALMLTAQGGGCAICGSDNATGRGGLPHVDHCHETGKVRGLLCDLCNRGLGHFNDNPALLRKAAEYLEASASA